MSHGLDKIDPRYVDGTRGRENQVLKLDGDKDPDFRDLVEVANPTGTTGHNGQYLFDNSAEFHTFILNHNNSVLKFTGLEGTRGSFQVRTFNNSGNGALNFFDFDEFLWLDQTPTRDVIIPSGQTYVLAATYHGDYKSQYPDLQDWSAVFVTEAP